MELPETTQALTDWWARKGTVAQPVGAGAAHEGKERGDGLPRSFQGGNSVKDERGGHRFGFDYVVHTNHAASTMPTRQGRARTRPSLVCSEGILL